MSAIIYLKGAYAPNLTNIDKCHQYYIDKDRIYLQDNDYGLNRRWYPISNVARVEDNK